MSEMPTSALARLQLAQWIARQAISEPYRQTDLLTTPKLVSFLRDRDIQLSASTLDGLARGGIVRPVALFAHPWLEAQPDRYFKIELGLGQATFVDVGPEKAKILPFDGSAIKGMADEPLDALWHPFQLWQFLKVSRFTLFSIESSDAFASVDQALLGIEKVLRAIRPAEGLVKWASSAPAEQFYNVLGLLCAAEPLVIWQMQSSIRMAGSKPPYDINAYRDWCDETNFSAFMTTARLSEDDAIFWHRELALVANLSDPIESWRELTRFAPRRLRKGFKGHALLCEDLYHAAEVLRRFLGTYGTIADLPDESGIIMGKHTEWFRERIYGSPRLSDASRVVFRQVVRKYHLDPQPRMRWIIEGDTEEAFIRRLAEIYGIDLADSGIELWNLKGLGGLDKDKLRGFLELSRQEEVFVQVTVDQDGKDASRILGLYAAEDLVPGGFHVFKEDFEEENFTLFELAEAATRLARQVDPALELSASEIKTELQERPASVGRAIERLLSRMHAGDLKGAAWGRVLADVVAESSELRERSVVEFFRRARGAQSVSYRDELDNQAIDRDGNMIPRIRPTN